MWVIASGIKGEKKEDEMPRRMFDCRSWPGECTLAISGEEEEVVEAQVLHVVQAHGQEDGTELRELIRASLKDAPVGA